MTTAQASFRSRLREQKEDRQRQRHVQRHAGSFDTKYPRVSLSYKFRIKSLTESKVPCHFPLPFFSSSTFLSWRVQKILQWKNVRPMCVAFEYHFAPARYGCACYAQIACCNRLSRRSRLLLVILAHCRTLTPSAAAAPQAQELPWLEKVRGRNSDAPDLIFFPLQYRPVFLDDIVGNEETINRLKVIAQEGNMPNIIISVRLLSACIVVYFSRIACRALRVPARQRAFCVSHTRSSAQPIKRQFWS